MGDFLTLAPAQDVARIRPLALARRLALEPGQVIAACLHGAHDGALVLLWDILCPICRIPAKFVDALAELGDTATATPASSTTSSTSAARSS